MIRKLKSCWARIAYFSLKPFAASLDSANASDIYASEMRTEFGGLYNFIFPRFFSKIRLDKDSLDTARAGLTEKTPVYITTNVGQLEYNFFNFLYLKEGLPLASFANGLTSWQWMPFRLALSAKRLQLSKRIDFGGELPDPVSSGYVEELLKEGKSIFVQLKSTDIYNDLYWDTPHEDIIQALIRAQKVTDKPIELLPQQFLWAKRPEKEKRPSENPGKLRKLYLFWKNYKNHAIVQFGEPLDLKEFLNANPSISEEEQARLLRFALLSMIRQERKRITGPAIKPRKRIIEEVVESEKVQNEICRIATENQKDTDDVRSLALKYAKEMTADVSYTYIENATQIMRWVFDTMYDGIHCNSESLAGVKKLAESSPVVFVPNHLSHVDYLLISQLLYSNNISIPHVAGGINLSFWPLGKIFRKCGAFFIRRSFSGNPLYKAVFDAYIDLLIREGYCQEFFIEGGRSRTGKLRQPRMGILSTITRSMLGGASEEIFFIPTSITYDRVIEEKTHTDESAGMEKKKEKFTDIFKLTRLTKHRYGKIYVNFGEPVSFSEARRLYSGVTDEAMLKQKITELLAFRIMHSLGSHIVVTPTAVVAASILMESKRGITTDQLNKNADLILNYLKFAGVQLSDSLNLNAKEAINESTNKLAENGTIEVHPDFDPLYYSLSEGDRPALSFQKNSIIQHLLPVAYVSSAILALLKSGKAQFTREEIEIQMEFLRSIFTVEFAAHAGIVTEESTKTAISFLGSIDAIRRVPETGAISTPPLGIDTLKKLSSLITNFLDSYLIAYHTCSRIEPDTAVDEKTLIKAMLKDGKHLLYLGQISRFEAISAPAFENAISFFKRTGFLVEAIAGDGQKEKPKYRWRADSPAVAELHGAFRLFA